MDLSFFIQKYPLLIEIVKGPRYAKHTRYSYITICRRIIAFHNNPNVNTYEEIFNELSRIHNYKKTTQDVFRRNFWRIVKYIEKDEWLFEGDSRKNLSNAYSKLTGEFKNTIDRFVEFEKAAGHMALSSMDSIVSSVACFFLYFQNNGKTTLKEIANQYVIENAFYEVETIRDSYDTAYKIKKFLLECSLICPLNEVYKTIYYFIPEYAQHKKLVDFLNTEEKKKIEQALNSDMLSFRVRAIARLAYDTGMRGADIINLKFDDFDTQTETIHFIQSKTKEYQILSFKPEVGNLICDYIEKERPHVHDEHIFLTEKAPFRPLTRHSLYGIAEKVYEVANVHTSNGRRQGLHLFRHAFATSLLEDNVESTIISCLLGHRSLKSIAPYLDADIEHLRSNALEISKFINVAQPVLKPYTSIVSEYFEKYRRELIQKNSWNWRTNMNLQLLDDILSRNSYEISTCFHLASLPLENESYYGYLKRIRELRKFACYLIKYNFQIEEIKPLENFEPNKRYPLIQREFRCSENSEMYSSFLSHSKSSNRWSVELENLLYKFDHFCYDHEYGNKKIDQEIIDKWSESLVSKGETGCKCIHAINRFIIYINKIYGYNLEIIDVVLHKTRTYARKNYFSETDLINFFFAVQHVSEQKYNYKDFYYANKIVAPNIFLLMFSSGMRPFECRMLARTDVDLENGVINIRKTKGIREHRVAISYELREVLRSYDERMEKILPDRKCFFPDKNDHYLSRTWMEQIFIRSWYLYNYENSNPYAFRHNYATTNINSWDKDKPEEFFKKLEYLSKSMGHTRLDCTIYYYSFTVSQYLKMKETVSESFNKLVPDRISYFEDYEKCQNQ